MLKTKGISFFVHAEGPNLALYTHFWNKSFKFEVEKT
jgi:hypothetical protein